MNQQQPTVRMIACPNCQQPTIPCCDNDGLLSDWCDSCDKSIFYDSTNVPLPAGTWNDDDVMES